MIYKVQYDNPNDDIITRLLKVRNIDDHIDNFLNPKLTDYWISPFLLNDMDKAVDRIVKALKNKEKIMIFGDYDVDGITSSYILYQFFKNFLEFDNISIQYPSRHKDGYGLKCHHIDEIKEKWVSVIITVDNGITSIQEAKHAKEVGIDLIITDHHKNLEKIPDAHAVVNPQISPEYEFKWIAGVWVAFKLIVALLEKSKFSDEKKTEVFNYFLPFVAIWTVADCVPLVHENRVIVKRWLDLINTRRNQIAPALKWFLDYLNIKKPIDTFHVGFMIWPRINAGGRIMTPYDSLYTLLYSGEKQVRYLQNIDDINNERKKLQEQAFKEAEKQLNHDKKILIWAHSDFHEWVVGIVSGRITERYNKPSMIMNINEEKWLATASLRWPEYFSVVDMIQSAADILERFGWHKQAGWLSVKIENLEKLYKHFEEYCEWLISENDLKKKVNIDTKLYEHERNNNKLAEINKLAPFGIWNEEPIFMIENFIIDKVEKVWQKGKWHAKIHGKIWNKKIVSMFWSKWDEIDNFLKKWKGNLIWKIKKDDFNWWYFVDWIELE